MSNLNIMFSKNDIDLRLKEKPQEGLMNVSTLLQHFSIVTYRVDFHKLRNLIPHQFEIDTIMIDGIKYGMLSAVSFIDKDFHFQKLLPFLKFEFPQTNYRAYVINKKTGEKCVWFFGTSLGSKFVFLPKYLWKMPWFYANYCIDIQNNKKYYNCKFDITTPNANDTLDLLIDENQDLILEGFECQKEAILVLTHPVTGYFLKGKDEIGKYKIWHPLMNAKKGICKNAYFEIYEKLGLLTKEQMKNPLSVLITKEIKFEIELPPRKFE